MLFFLTVEEIDKLLKLYRIYFLNLVMNLCSTISIFAVDESGLVAERAAFIYPAVVILAR